VAEHYGKKPIIYTTVDFFEDNDLARFRAYPFWLRSVAAHPDDRYRGLPWVFWQYTGTGIVPGIEGDADLNTFNGGTDDWRKWLNANTT
jgi:lysozyme